MKLDYRYSEIEEILGGNPSNDHSTILSVAFDSRRIVDGQGILFVALSGNFRDGHDFILDAYERGVRHFLVEKPGISLSLDGAHEIVVENALKGLQKLARHHRLRFSCPVIGITGSNGKTTVKEWLCQLLQKKWNVARSPKSYNSQLGVAVSLLEIGADTEVAVIEAGISAPGEMRHLQEMIQPTHGIFSAFGTAHREHFESVTEHLAEKMVLFSGLDYFLVPAALEHLQLEKAQVVQNSESADLLELLPFKEKVQQQNAALAIKMAEILGLDQNEIREGLQELHPLTMRLESYEGISGNNIINDTYSLDLDSLRLSLEYQLTEAKGKERVLVLGLAHPHPEKEAQLLEVSKNFAPIEVYFYYPDQPFLHQITGKSILFKGMRAARMEQLARQFKQQQHQTYLEIDLSAIRDNIKRYKAGLKDSTQMLCMVKASSYGSDAKTMGKFLEGMGINCLGVAYVDEGVELRKSGITLPIFVMNCEESGYAQCIEHRLEPAFFSVQQLNAFVVELINRSMLSYPVHIKLETGMNRLGFQESELRSLISFVKGQPEIYIRSVYSHLAESDKVDSDFTRHQIECFALLADQLENEFPQPFLRHLLNSSGIWNYPEAQFDMVRLGIGMYGVMEDPRLQNAIAWYSVVSQIKYISTGESVGYNREFIAKDATRIAVVPVGYADGFRRSLSKGNGGVYIGGQWCPTVGNVCMDMIMVDIGQAPIKAGDPVEIIGQHQSMSEFARRMQTIPYEVMTSFSSRVHRIFVER